MDTSLDCPLMPDGEARDAMIELFSAREKAAKWKRRYYEEKNKR